MKSWRRITKGSPSEDTSLLDKHNLDLLISLCPNGPNEVMLVVILLMRISVEIGRLDLPVCRGNPVRVVIAGYNPIERREYSG